MIRGIHRVSVPMSAATREKPVASAAQGPKDRVELGQAEIDLPAVLKATAAEASSLASKLPEHVEGQVLVKVKPGMLQEDFVASYGASVVHRFDIPEDLYQDFGGDLLQIQLPPGLTTAQAMVAMERDPRVIYAASNDILHVQGEAVPRLPDDLDPRLWGLHNTGQQGGRIDADIDAPEAWSLCTGSRQGPVIAVIDTGIDYTHQDLAANVWTNPNEVADGTDTDGNGIVDDLHGYNAITDSGDPMDDHSHGTHCSGTIAGDGTNGQGVHGVNWEAQLMGVKFLSASGSGSTADAIKGVLYAARMGARITSNSWGGGAYNEALKDALATSPALHIFAAGNANSNNDARASYPASYNLDNIVAVAASDRNDRRASFSNYGAESVDLAAPGNDIYSTVPGNRYATYSGTSMATPHVAGVAGLIATLYPEASNEEIKSRLLNGADPVRDFQGRVLTGGRLNAYNALEDDRVPPGAPNDFRGTDANARSMTLGWTAPGDDGWCGQATGYDLRMSDSPITDQDAFEVASRVATSLASETGTLESATVDLVPSGQERELHFALKVYDNVGNLSEVRNAAVTVPAARLAFEDNMDGSDENWTTDTWGRVEEPGRGQVWTDSPNGNYGNNQSRILASRPISLEGLDGSTLIFDSRYDIESGFDTIFIEVSRDGENWIRAAHFSGTSDWKTRLVDLSDYDGENVQMRFRLESDGSVNRDGFYLDRVVIAG